MYKHFFKRVLDFIGALVGLMVTVWLHFANKVAGAFFLQERPGLNERIFKVIKFKTMTLNGTVMEICYLTCSD